MERLQARPSRMSKASSSALGASARAASQLQRYGSKMAKQNLWSVAKEWKRRRRIHIDKRRGDSYQLCSILWADNWWWAMSHSTTHLEQVMKELIEGAERWDLEPVVEHQCRRGPGGHLGEDEGKGTQVSFLKKRLQKILGYLFKPSGTAQESLNKAWWRDAKIHRNNSVSWKMKCKSTVEQVYRVFCFGCKRWSWSIQGHHSLSGAFYVLFCVFWCCFKSMSMVNHVSSPGWLRSECIGRSAVRLGYLSFL